MINLRIKNYFVEYNKLICSSSVYTVLTMDIGNKKSC